MFGPEVSGQWSKLWFWRLNMTTSGFTNTPMIIGEYADWAGCIEQPTDLAVNQSSAIWTALVTAIIYGDQSPTQPIIGASTFTFESGGPPVCDSWHLTTTKVTTLNPCRGSDTAYYSPVGLALGQFASLTGNRTKTTVVGGPNLLSLPAASQPLVGAPSVTAVSSSNGFHRHGGPGQRLHNPVRDWVGTGADQPHQRQVPHRGHGHDAEPVGPGRQHRQRADDGRHDAPGGVGLRRHGEPHPPAVQRHNRDNLH